MRIPATISNLTKNDSIRSRTGYKALANGFLADIIIFIQTPVYEEIALPDFRSGPCLRMG
jgi:hypothetical protein